MRLEYGEVGAIKRFNDRNFGSTLNTETVREVTPTRHTAIPLHTEYRKEILQLSNKEVDTRDYSSTSFFVIEHGHNGRWRIVTGKTFDKEYRILRGIRGVFTVVKK